jgi:threonine synthase
MIESAYASFNHPAVAPLTQVDDNRFILELFHGPTLAFKDVAMQLLARLMDWSLERRRTQATIIGATSGDTGGAAIEAFRDSRHARVFILHPHGRVSDVQRRQMTCVDSGRVFNLAIEGTFDDCQSIVKALFNDHGFRDQVGLAGVNSINWARVMAQIVYYVTAAVALGAPDRAASFAVPTGNFGDVFAGYVASRMGLPIERLIVATNRNDILARFFATGEYRVCGVTPTISPSMDIQVASNFERLLLDLHDGDGAEVARDMTKLHEDGGFRVSAANLEKARRLFDGHRVDESETRAAIATTYRETGWLPDPHTAVGLTAARLRHDPRQPTVTLATAHAAKFPEAVMEAVGFRPEVPPRLAELTGRPERCARLKADLGMLKQFITKRARLGQGTTVT